MNKRKGFTLIELLVVIAIIAVLMGIMMPTLRAVREQGRRAACLSHVKNLITGLHTYAADYDDHIPASHQNHNASLSFYAWLSWTDPPSWTGLGRLYGTGIITDPEIFYCPAQQNPVLKPGRHDEGWNWETDNGNESRAISYLYGLLAEIRSAPELELKSRKLSALKERALICDIFVPFDEGIVWAHPKGLSTGFAAGHVEFKKVDKEIREKADRMEYKDINTRDLFTAAMFEWLANNPQVMNQNFLGGEI